MPSNLLEFGQQLVSYSQLMCTYSANLKTCCFTQNIFHFSLIKEQLSALKLRSQIMCKYIFVVLKLKRWKKYYK